MNGNEASEDVNRRAGHLMEKVMDLVRDGNVRRIFIKDSSAKTVMEVPVSVGILAALAAKYLIDVERDHSESAEPDVTSPA